MAGSGRPRRGLAGLGEGLGDKLLGVDAAAAALELAAHRAIGAFGIAVPAAGCGADIGLANQITRTNDHEGVLHDNATYSQVCATRRERGCD